MATEALRDLALAACGRTCGPGPLHSCPVLLPTLTAGGEARPLAFFPLLENSVTLVSMSCHPLLCKPPKGIQHYSRHTAIVSALLTLMNEGVKTRRAALFFSAAGRSVLVTSLPSG